MLSYFSTMFCNYTAITNVLPSLLFKKLHFGVKAYALFFFILEWKRQSFCIITVGNYLFEIVFFFLYKET